jgi:hypothetical protein
MCRSQICVEIPCLNVDRCSVHIVPTSSHWFQRFVGSKELILKAARKEGPSQYRIKTDSLVMLECIAASTPGQGCSGEAFLECLI